MPDTKNSNEVPSGDDALAEEIIKSIDHPKLHPIPVSSVKQLVAGLSLADLFVGADGGALHIAAGLGIPIVGLYENLDTKVKHWHPWQVKCRIVVTDTDRVASISCERVLNAVRELLLQSSS